MDVMEIENIVKKIRGFYLQLKEDDFVRKLLDISIVFVKEMKTDFSFTYMCIHGNFGEIVYCSK